MIKKIILICLIHFFVFSCGKKGDPVYKANFDMNIVSRT